MPKRSVSKRSGRAGVAPPTRQTKITRAMAERRAILAKHDPRPRPFIERALALDPNGEQYRQFVEEGRIPGTDEDRRKLSAIEQALDAELAAWEQKYDLAPGVCPTVQQVERIRGAAQALAGALRLAAKPDYPPRPIRRSSKAIGRRCRTPSPRSSVPTGVVASGRSGRALPW